MSLRVACPHCDAVANADDNTAGLGVPCPKCNKVFRIPQHPEGRIVGQTNWGNLATEKGKPDAGPARPASIVDVALPLNSVFFVVLKVVVSVGLLALFVAIIGAVIIGGFGAASGR